MSQQHAANNHYLLTLIMLLLPTLLFASLQEEHFQFDDEYHLLLISDSPQPISFSSYRLTSPNRIVVEIHGEVLTQIIKKTASPVTKIEVKDGGESLRLVFHIVDHSFYSILNRNNSLLLSFATLPVEDENNFTQALTLLHTKKAEQKRLLALKESPKQKKIVDPHAEEKMITELAHALKIQETEEIKRQQEAELKRVAAKKEEKRLAILLQQKQEEERKQQALALKKAEEEREKIAELARIKAEKERVERAEQARIAAKKEQERLEEQERIKAEKERVRLAELALIAAKKERERVAQLEQIRVEKERQRQAELLRQKQEAEQQKQALARKRAEEERKKKEALARKEADEKRKKQMALLEQRKKEAIAHKKAEEKRKKQMALLEQRKKEAMARKKMIKTSTGDVLALKVVSPQSNRSLDGETPTLAVTTIRKEGVLNNLFFRKFPLFARITMELTGDVDYQLKEIKGGFVINIYNFKVVPQRLLNIIDTRYFNSVVKYIYPKKVGDIFKVYIKAKKGTAVRQSKEGLMVNFDFYTPTIK